MNIYGIVFGSHGKVYYFNGEDVLYEIHQNVIVETEKGIQYGKIVKKINNESLLENNRDFKRILRKATDEDTKQYMDNLKDADKALKKARIVANDLNLNMNFIDCNYTFDRQQLTFNFYADSRVDFRDLAKRLASIYHTRIDLRQVGARDRACSISGIGVCGKEVCCSRFLKSFDSVTMNMAKNQNLALNPNKINGVCGRLLCCLAYEDDEYTKCSYGMPSVGQKVKIKGGVGNVISVDILNRRYKVLVEDQVEEVHLDEKSK